MLISLEIFKYQCTYQIDCKIFYRWEGAQSLINPSFRRNHSSDFCFHCFHFRFIQCAHQRIHHISNADYEEFVSIVCTARNAFYLAPGGLVQFNELLQSLRRSKSCRKDLWTRIVSGLATGSVWQFPYLGTRSVFHLMF